MKSKPQEIPVFKKFKAEELPLLLDEQSGKMVPVTMNFVLPGFDKPSRYVPKGNPEYVFRKNLFRDVGNFLRAPYGHALWLSGPTGSGKTSVLLELASRINWPVQNVTCHSRLEFDDLVGRTQVIAVPGETAPRCRFIYGPLARAMKNGHILILNEIDLVDPAQLSGLNDILEGHSLVVVGNGGEVIEPHPMFRVVVTANSKGGGDDSGSYCGVMTQNVAAMDRYRVLEVPYLPQNVEAGVLKNVFGDQIPEDIRNSMVRLANKVRESYETGVGFSAPMSTRTLILWGYMVCDYAECPNKMKETLRLSFGNRLSKPEQLSLYTVAQQIFSGSCWLDEGV